MAARNRTEVQPRMRFAWTCGHASATGRGHAYLPWVRRRQVQLTLRLPERESGKCNLHTICAARNQPCDAFDAFETRVHMKINAVRPASAWECSHKPPCFILDQVFKLKSPVHNCGGRCSVATAEGLPLVGQRMDTYEENFGGEHRAPPTMPETTQTCTSPPTPAR